MDLLLVTHVPTSRPYLMRRIDVPYLKQEYLFLHYLQQCRFRQAGFLRLQDELCFHYTNYEDYGSNYSVTAQ